MPNLFAYGRQVRTPFGILGTDENSLTFALGYTMQQCPRLLQMFLSAIGLKGIRIASLQHAKIHLQTHRAEGITDIEVILPGRFHVIIEAKVGLNIPSLEQCRRYIKTLKSSTAKECRLVMLVDADTAQTLEVYRGKDEVLDQFLVGFRWVEFFDMRPGLFKKLSPNHNEGRWVRAFFEFLDGEFQMKSYTEEVWIVPASTKPLWEGGWSLYDTHVKGKIYYRTTRIKQRPLYIALRANGQVKALQRVLRVEYEAKLTDYVPEMKSIKPSWPSKPHTIWHLSEPTSLPKSIRTGDKFMRARHVYCDIDILLSSSTVKEAEERMKQRKTNSGT